MSLQFITSMCMSPFECQTGFKMMYAKPCLGKIPTSVMALKQPQRKVEIAIKLMTKDRSKLHSNREKCKQNSKILTVKMVPSSIQETIGFEIQLRDIPNGRPKTGSASLEGISHDL